MEPAARTVISSMVKMDDHFDHATGSSTLDTVLDDIVDGPYDSEDDSEEDTGKEDEDGPRMLTIS